MEAIIFAHIGAGKSIFACEFFFANYPQDIIVIDNAERGTLKELGTQMAVVLRQDVIVLASAVQTGFEKAPDAPLSLMEAPTPHFTETCSSLTVMREYPTGFI